MRRGKASRLVRQAAVAAERPFSEPRVPALAIGRLRILSHQCEQRHVSERYEPPSDFLKAVIDDDVPLVGGDFASANLRRLIEMTRDDHPANRDWATLLLSQQDLDTPEVRDALLRAAEDENDAVRAEAIRGLARRDKGLALPPLRRELARTSVTLPIFEAATLIADPSLAGDLRAFASPSGDEFLDRCVLDALEACENGQAA